MKNGLIIACWIGVVAIGAFLRFDQLTARPVHSDEATGARITAFRMEAGSYRFDPHHYHGPLLSALAIPLCKLYGETNWQEMTKATLRTLPALAGTLLILVPLLGRRRWGDWPVLCAASLLATSPLLVYYSRMFIHEPLLVLFGLLALLTLLLKPGHLITGILVGLMFATKESFVISLTAWAAAGIMVAKENRNRLDRPLLVSAWNQYRMPIVTSTIAAAVTACWFYTDGFRQQHGAWDAARTFFVYETVAGHDKGFGYYIHLLAWPKHGAGVWWCEAAPLVLAVLAYLSTFGPNGSAMKHRTAIRFLAYAAAGHILIYSVIAYKTPWLMCLPWAHVLLLAGFSISGFPAWRPSLKLAFSSFLALCLVSQFIQARQASGRLASDSRNPYAYVPTSGDMETLEPLLHEFGGKLPGPVAVIGHDYWPLPWYLRGCGKVGYWPELPSGLESFPLVFAMPETAGTAADALAYTHTALPRGLRADVPVLLFIRNDIWQKRTDPTTP